MSRNEKAQFFIFNSIHFNFIEYEAEVGQINGQKRLHICKGNLISNQPLVHIKFITKK